MVISRNELCVRLRPVEQIETGATKIELEQVTQQSVAYSVERNFEREAVSDERELMRDALNVRWERRRLRVRQRVERENDDRILTKRSGALDGAVYSPRTK